MLKHARIGQRSERSLGQAHCFPGSLEYGRQVALALTKPRAVRLDTLDRRSRRISRTSGVSRLALSGQRRMPRLLGRHSALFHLAKSIVAVRQRCLDGILEVRKLSREHGQAVYPKQPFGGRGPRDDATKPSHRRKRPASVTSRWPTASGCPSSLSATPTCFSRRDSSGGAET